MVQITGERAVDRINGYEVVHVDLPGQNMALATEKRAYEGVVILDIDNSVVFDVAWGMGDHRTLDSV